MNVAVNEPWNNRPVLAVDDPRVSAYTFADFFIGTHGNYHTILDSDRLGSGLSGA
jgi:hypothetical protein